MKQYVRPYIVRLAATGFVRSAITEQADLSAFREKPSALVLAGVFAIACSFVLGWPTIAALGYLSLTLNAPWIVVVGGPCTYLLSHVVFLLGMYLSGTTYSLIFCRWLVRITMEWCLNQVAAQPFSKIDT